MSSATLADYDDAFPTAAPSRSGSTLELKDMVDGEYDFAVKECEIKDTKAGPMISMKLEVMTDGNYCGGVIERAYWLTKKDEASGQRVRNESQLAELRKDLMTLGFDADQWTKENGRPFSVEMGKVPAAIPGVCFRGKKKTNGKYHNLYVNERSKEDARPAKFGPDELNDANEDPFGN